DNYRLPPGFGSGPTPEGAERGLSGDGPRVTDKAPDEVPRRGWRPAPCSVASCLLRAVCVGPTASLRSARDGADPAFHHHHAVALGELVGVLLSRRLSGPDGPTAPGRGSARSCPQDAASHGARSRRAPC